MSGSDDGQRPCLGSIVHAAFEDADYLDDANYLTPKVR